MQRPEPDLADRTPAELARLALAAARELARRPPDGATFPDLLQLLQVAGQCIGGAARDLAAHRSWGAVAGAAGTSRQAAWARWHDSP